MKKLLYFHFKRFDFAVVWSVLAVVLCSIVFDSFRLIPFSFSFVTIVLFAFIYLMMPFMQLYDLYGDSATFMQTLPYSRRKLVSSKLLFQLITNSCFALAIVLSQLANYEISFIKMIATNYNAVNLVWLVTLLLYVIIVIDLTLIMNVTSLVFMIMALRIKRWYQNVFIAVPLLIIAIHVVAFVIILPWLPFDETIKNLIPFILLGLLPNGLLLGIITWLNFDQYQRLNIHGVSTNLSTRIDYYQGRS